MVYSCEFGNEPPSSIECGECSLFPCWSGLIGTPVSTYLCIIYVRMYVIFEYQC